MCVFCEIISGRIPCYKIYEDDKVLSFLDIRPVNPGHIIVIPKEHFQNIEEAPEDVLAAMMLAVKKAGAMLKGKLGYAGYNVMENNDPVAGQVVPHIHFHVIPRREGDGNEQWKQGDYAAGEAEETLRKLIS